MKDTIILILIIIILVILTLWGLNSSERTQCFKLQSDAEKYPQFYITEWQNQMCQAHNVEINAPIK